MHVAHEVVHARELVVVGVHDEVDAVVDGREVRVGHDARNLDDHVLFDVEARHLEVDPHEPSVLGAWFGARFDARRPTILRHMPGTLSGSRATGRFPPSVPGRVAARCDVDA